MLIKVYFRYSKEVWSFLNKNFTKCTIGFFIFILLVGIFCSDFKTTTSVLFFILLVYLGFGIKTIAIKKEQNKFIKNGKKCSGIIKDIKVEKGHTDLVNSWENRYTIVYLIVEYLNPNTNKLEQFTTESVNGNPYNYLSSLDVTVYVLPDGNAWATDFRRIEKLSDSVKYQTDEKYKKQIDSEGKNRTKLVLYCIIFFLIMGFLITKANFIICFTVILTICVISILFGNKK